MTVTATARPSPTGHPGYTQTLPCTARSVVPARSLVRTALETWGLEHLTDTGALIVTELVSNSVTHTRTYSIRLTITRPSQVVVRIAVVDNSRTIPTLRRPTGDHDETGRGLAIITDIRRGDYVLRPVQGPGEWIAEDPTRLRFIAPAVLPRRTPSRNGSDGSATALEIDALVEAGAFWRLAPEWVPRDGYETPSPAVLRELEAGLKKLTRKHLDEVPTESRGAVEQTKEEE